MTGQNHHQSIGKILLKHTLNWVTKNAPILINDYLLQNVTLLDGKKCIKIKISQCRCTTLCFPPLVEGCKSRCELGHLVYISVTLSLQELQKRIYIN